MRCPQCNYDNADIAKFCAHCGAKLVETRVQVFCKAGSWHVGLRDADTGETIIEPKYYSINGICDSETPKILTNKKLFIACGHESETKFSSTVYDINGNIVIQGGLFHDIYYFPEQSMFICFAEPDGPVQPGYYAYDVHGNCIFRYKYKVTPYSVYKCIACAENEDGLCGYIDIRSGKPIVEFKWVEAHVFKIGYAAVKDRHTKKWGIINTKGELVVPCEYSDIFINEDGNVQYNKHWYSFGQDTTITDLINKYK